MASHRGNLYSDIPIAPRNYPNEVISQLVDTVSSNSRGSSALKIERIVSSGHTTEYVRQDNDEFVVLLQGKAKVVFQDKEGTDEIVQDLKLGDYLFIPKGTRHRVTETSNDPLAIWYAMICIYIHAYIHTYKHTYIYTCIHVYICTYISTCIYTCIHICMHAYTCTHTLITARIQ